jgi:5'-methylthioadenosine phosphorylase
MNQRLGIIGGSGFYEMEDLQRKRWVSVETPFGKPSGHFLLGRLGQQEVVFLARHGREHQWLPSEINYRANIYGMKKLNVSWIVAVSAVGSLREEIKPLDFVIIDQFVDRTTRRESTFFGNGMAVHISFADPFCEDLRKRLIRICERTGVRVHPKGIYLNMEGPAFSTRAESHLYRSWGMDVIGMTNLIEAKLAREAEMCYATIAMVTDYDCWRENEAEVTVTGVIQNLRANKERVQEAIRKLIQDPPQDCVSGCREALKHAIITSRDKIPLSMKKKLKILIGKYL